MNSRVSSGLTACVAIAGASVIAMTPVMSSAPTPPRVVDAAAELMASFAGKDQLALTIIAGERLVDQFVQAPLVPLVLAAQLAGGDNARLYSQLRQIVDSPVYVADPLIEAIANTLPDEFGGGSDHETTTSAGDGAFMQFRNNEILGLRDDINAQVAGALGVSPTVLNENYAAKLAAGIQESALRTVNGAVLGAVGVVAVAQAVAEGDNVALYTAVRQYTDAPLWAADPTIKGLEAALPASLGGGANGGIAKFRDERLWTATRDTRVTIAKALNVNVDANGDNPTSNASNLRGTSLMAAKADTASSTVSGKPNATSLTAQLNKAKDKAEQRRADRKEKANNAVKKVKNAVKNATKNLKPKASED